VFDPITTAEVEATAFSSIGSSAVIAARIPSP
jgi:hypothetical protein